ncbi:glucokinase [Actinomadura rudentiformis]|uniref:Glucokinase n=1 Tax=Actinomadura rudentiformis TaxID=359158 RepID=A0A6H9YS35_9ACTN|nr:glucokinase [Actinomadura rudentiformis]KAB2349570.1 glucokinase [Actinomadura rudentiformis]
MSPAGSAHGAAHPWLVADVGGTNARFALVEEPGAAPSRIGTLASRDHAGLAEAAATYLAEHAEGTQPGAACLAVAGPVVGGRFRLTNADWEPDTAERVGAHLGLAHVEVLNDFEALALSLPHIGEADLRPVGGRDLPIRDGSAPLSVLGPGTGLGMAGLIPTPGGWVPLPGEGGQVDVPAGTDREVEVMRLLRAEQGAANAEFLLSGDGLARLYRLLATVHGDRVEPLTAAEICVRRDKLCVETIEMFCALLGAFAGNAALTLGARGGVYLGGGILPRIADVLESSDFRRRFEAKPRVEEYVRAIPTALIVHPNPALVGATARLAQTLATSPLEYV